MLGNLQDLLKAKYHQGIERLKELKFDLVHKVGDIAEILTGDYRTHLVIKNSDVPMNHRHVRYFLGSIDYYTKLEQYLDGNLSVDRFVPEIKPHFILLFDNILGMVKEGSGEVSNMAYKSRYIPTTILSTPDSRLSEGAGLAKNRMIEIRDRYKK